MKVSTAQEVEREMAVFKPFKAWRYDTQKVSAGDIIAPPYDIISPSEQRELYRKSPYNCIRLILNQRESLDSEQNNPYTRARDFFRQWRDQSVLFQEPTPSYYLYRQFFKNPDSGASLVRTAILGRLKLEPFEKGIVVPHERTLSKAREDRRRLLEATQTNFSPVFGLFDDPDNSTGEIAEHAAERVPIFEAADDKNVKHVLWAVSEEAWIHRIQDLFCEKKIYIADGHHRYTTALEYAGKQRLIHSEAERGSDYVFMALVAFQDPGLILFPTHRMILPFDGFEQRKALAALQEYFQIEMMPLQKIKETLSHSHQNGGLPIQFGLYFQDKSACLLTLKDFSKVRPLMPQEQSDQWRQIDVAVLSHFILKELWGLPENKWEAGIRYTHSAEDAIREVDQKNCVVSFFLTSPRVEILREMGETRELLPQKSTYFWPKLASGLAFYCHHV